MAFFKMMRLGGLPWLMCVALPAGADTIAEQVGLNDSTSDTKRT